MSQEHKNRNLTDDDVIAIADALEGRIAKRFYLNLGKGVWGMLWRGVVAVIVFISAYGTVKGHL